MNRRQTTCAARAVIVTALSLLVLFTAGCNRRPPAQVLDWGVLDKTTNTNTDLPSGATFTLNPTHEYIVTFRARDPDGVKHLAIWGEGFCECAFLDGSVLRKAPNNLRVKLPRKDQALSGQSFQAFVPSDRFEYSTLSCGVHHFGNTPGPREYFATNGTIRVQGEETSGTGRVSTATLNLQP